VAPEDHGVLVVDHQVVFQVEEDHQAAAEPPEDGRTGK
jgi:hypothetical protein